jgi:tRNA (guanine37-N1)-methyltransferase
VKTKVKFQVITLFPQLVEAIRLDGVIGQGLKLGLVELTTINPREFTEDIHRTVDDRPFGGGDGMLMMAEPLALALESIGLEGRGHVVYLSPKGKVLTDQKVQELAGLERITLICGRYGGVDQRFIGQYVDEEISIGDYVLSGGELAASVLIDAVSRFVPGVLGHADSVHQDSHTMGGLEAPTYTRPRVWRGQEVPEVLLSGNHEKIEEWRLFVGGLLTFALRPELFRPPPLFSKKGQRWRTFAESLSSEQKRIWRISDLNVSEFLKKLETKQNDRGS